MNAPRAILALLTAGWRTAISYRVRFLVSMVSVGVSIIPMFFIARAVQPVMGPSIAGEGTEYFAFILLGFVVLGLVQVAGDALPNQVSGDISNGFFEAMTSAPVGTSAILAGLMAYPMAFMAFRGLLTMGLGTLLGISFFWANILPASLILILLLLAHIGVGLIATSGVVMFRSTFAIPQAFSATSAFLGGALWPVSVIPGWLQSISDVLPLTYGLRSLRMVLLEGSAFAAVRDDVIVLGAAAGFLFLVGVTTLSGAIGRARRVGSLSQY